MNLQKISNLENSKKNDKIEGSNNYRYSKAAVFIKIK